MSPSQVKHGETKLDVSLDYRLPCLVWSKGPSHQIVVQIWGHFFYELCQALLGLLQKHHLIQPFSQQHNPIHWNPSRPTRVFFARCWGWLRPRPVPSLGCLSRLVGSVGGFFLLTRVWCELATVIQKKTFKHNSLEWHWSYPISHLKTKHYMLSHLQHFLVKPRHWGWSVWKLIWGMASDLSLDGLSKLLQKHEEISDYALESKELLKWPSLKKKGLINMHSMGLNSNVILIVLQKWVPQLDKLKTLNIAQIKHEVGYDWFFMIHHVTGSVHSQPPVPYNCSG